MWEELMDDLKKVGWRVEEWYSLAFLGGIFTPTDDVRYYIDVNRARAKGEELSVSSRGEPVVEVTHVLTKDGKTGYNLFGREMKLDEDEDIARAEALRKVGTVLTAEECDLLGLPFPR